MNFVCPLELKEKEEEGKGGVFLSHTTFQSCVCKCGTPWIA